MGWLEIGKIVAPQGLNGELRVYPDTDFPERFEVAGKRWLLRLNATEPEEVELIKGRFLEGKNLYVIQLAGVNHRDQAEELRGCKILVPENDRPPLGEDEYHLMDLVGLSVFMQENGEFIGTVVNLIAAGNDLLEVRLGKEGTRGQGDKGIRGEGDEEKIENPSWKVLGEDNLHPKLSAKSKIENSKTVLIPFVREIVPVVSLSENRIEITPPIGLLEI
ncbi:MAG: ribosome maturation factor RimM [Nostocales cyanobacterium 94392]|nr:ribosome maturation factor RimM [Nostocales cyanobacterium 94392]